MSESLLPRLLVALALLPFVSSALVCKSIIGDRGWPTWLQWSSLNSSVDGRLIQTVPLGTPCYPGPLFNAAACANIQKNWHTPDLHEATSSSIMSAPFSNRSCDPFQTTFGCSIGTYVAYAVDVATVWDVINAINFARNNNLRFVVRNTGHDYMGKSTGGSALAVWMHNIKNTTWMPSYTSASYKGPAVKLGAGVTIDQVNREGADHGFVVVTGACPSVGVVGGYIQGGGTGPISTNYGLLADNVLSFEVILPNGQFVNASATQNADLFWALSGGGGGTYGIVWSATVKAFPEVPVLGVNMYFSTASNVSLDLWWSGVDAYRLMTANLTDIGGYSLAVYTPGSFTMAPAMVFNKTTAQLDAVLTPFTDTLSTLGIPYSLTISSFSKYLDAHTALFPNALFDVQNSVVGGRLLSRSLWNSRSTFDTLNKGIRSIVDSGAGAYDITVAPSLAGKALPNNAVLPQWRTTQAEFAFFLPWNDTGTPEQYQQQKATMINTLTPIMKKVSPDAGAYLNEADPFDPDWKVAFYGKNYDTLLGLKTRFDPSGLLYGATAVGGDQWKEVDGRLCKT